MVLGALPCAVHAVPPVSPPPPPPPPPSHRPPLTHNPPPTQPYELHRNDCRHYINGLVAYSTGQQHAASAALAQRWAAARERGQYGLATGVVRLVQLATDLANWGKVRLVSNASAYAMLALSGQKALARLPALLPGAKARLRPVVGKAVAAPVAGHVRGALLARKPVVVGTTAAVATLAGARRGRLRLWRAGAVPAVGCCHALAPAHHLPPTHPTPTHPPHALAPTRPAASSSQAPMLRETVTVGARVATAVRSAAHATLAAATTAVTRASAATTRTTSQAVEIAGSVAGAATRGAVQLVGGRPAAGPLEWFIRPASPPRASLGALRAADRSQRLALAITSAARR